jgi:hypothetical protein
MKNQSAEIAGLAESCERASHYGFVNSDLFNALLQSLRDGEFLGIELKIACG